MEDNPKMVSESRKSILSKRLKTKYPDMNMEDEESVYGRITDDYDEYDKNIADRDKEIETYKEREKALSDMFTSDPRSAAFFMEMKRGEDPRVSFIRDYGEDIVDIINDPDKQEEVAAANKEYVQKVAKNKKLEEEYKKNLAESLAYIDSLETGDNARKPEEVDAAFALLLQIANDGIVGKFTPESFAMAFKAINHDTDVINAGEDGEVRGRNAKIDEKLRKSKAGDGVAPLGGQNNTPDNTPKRDYGPLNRYGEGNTTIWERGGEKRTRIA